MAGGSLLRPGTEPQIAISLGGREYLSTRARLGTFVYLQQARKDMRAAAARGENGTLTDALFVWMQTAIGVERAEFERASWLEIGVAYGRLDALNLIEEELPILRSTGGKVPRWDYPRREIIAWVDMIAHAYGWSKDEIVNLYPEEAVAIWQEIAAREYYERRFDHALSQVAYETDRSGRVTYRPLDMPFWMATGDSHKVKIPKTALPIGNIIFPRNAPKELVH